MRPVSSHLPKSIERRESSFRAVGVDDDRDVVVVDKVTYASSRLAVAALVRAMKVMSAGLDGGTSFMEDYTYHLNKSGMKVLARVDLRVPGTVAVESRVVGQTIFTSPVADSDSEPISLAALKMATL